MLSDRNARFNGKAIALYLFQFSLLIPFTRIIEPKIFVALVSSITVLAVILKNRSFIINSQILKLFLFVSFLLITKSILGQTDFDFIVNCTMYIVPVLCLFFFPIHYPSCLNLMFFFSKLSFFLLVLIPFSNNLNYSYMRFGYGMVPVVILAYIEFSYYFNTNSITGIKYFYFFLDLIIMLIGTLEIVLYGARGCSFALLLFVILDKFIVKHFSVFKCVFSVIISLFLYLNLELIFDILERITSILGIFSYSLFKFKRQLLYGFENASSGRVELYSNAIEKILQYPLFGGDITTDVMYFHNVFLQVGADLGIFAVIILIVFMLYDIHLLGVRETIKEEKLLLLILFSTSFGRLMFSSSIWQRPEFWLLVFFVASIKYNKKYN